MRQRHAGGAGVLSFVGSEHAGADIHLQQLAEIALGTQLLRSPANCRHRLGTGGFDHCRKVGALPATIGAHNGGAGKDPARQSHWFNCLVNDRRIAARGGAGAAVLCGNFRSAGRAGMDT